ncbi:MAG: ATP-binding protein [Bacteroidota bacterium]
MLLTLRAFWDWVSGIGLDKDLPEAERPKVRLLNQILAGTFPIHILITIQDFIQRDGPGVLITLIPFAITLITFFLQSRGWYILARVFIILFMTMAMLGLSFLYGRELGAEFTFLTMSLGVIVLFEHQNGWQIAMFVLLFLAYELLQWSYSFHEPFLIEQLNASTNHLVFTAALLGCILIGRIFLESRRKIERQKIAALRDLKQKNKELKQANSDLERFAFVASHDLKTPLRNINNFLGLIERRLPHPVPKELQEYLQIASNNARHMYYLIEDILQYSRLDKEPEVFVTDLNMIVRRAKMQLFDFIEESGAEIVVGELPPILGNEGQLELLFQNLIENGIKYNEAEVPRVEITAELSGNRNIIRIVDNGIGIKDVYQSKIFDMFYRLHTQDRYEGTGIGLAICKKIAEKNRGNIRLESQFGSGSAFVLDFPLAERLVNLQPA